MTATERAKALRSRHRIRPSSMAWGVRCEVDRVRVHPVLGGGWRHDVVEMRALNTEAAREAVPA